MLNFKKLRLERNLSQKDVAAILGITQQAYANYERGARQADYKSLEILAIFFHVTTDYLLGISENEQKKIRSSEEERILNLLENDEQLRKLIDAAARLTPAERAVLASYADFQAHELSKEHQE